MAEATAPKQAPKTCEHRSHETNEPHHHDSWAGLVQCLGSERCPWCNYLWGSYPRYQK